MEPIFVITTRRGLNVEADERTIGWYGDLISAKATVENNFCDIHETVYEYAIIEEVHAGLYPDIQVEVWFQWKNGKYVEIPKPEEIKDFCNWAIG
jgi:hypothetical protein